MNTQTQAPINVLLVTTAATPITFVAKSWMEFAIRTLDHANAASADLGSPRIAKVFASTGKELETHTLAELREYVKKGGE